MHRVENSTKYSADDLCVNLVYVRIFLLDARWPPLFLRQITSFPDSFHDTKNEKNLYVGSFNFFSYAIQIGSNWYIDTGVRDLDSRLHVLYEL